MQALAMAPAKKRKRRMHSQSTVTEYRLVEAYRELSSSSASDTTEYFCDARRFGVMPQYLITSGLLSSSVNSNTSLDQVECSSLPSLRVPLFRLADRTRLRRSTGRKHKA
jgi:hypothetical protein